LIERGIGVEPICRTLGVSASAYYQRATGERSARAVEDERLLEVIRTTHKRNHAAYGSGDGSVARIQPTGVSGAALGESEQTCARRP
jgi:hypothetical protein